MRVLHFDETGPFSKASGDVTIEKNFHSAFAGTSLAAWLNLHKLSRIVVSGARTEQCCETTTRHGSDSGFTVDYVTEATLTFPMIHLNGRQYSVSEINERTELVLHGSAQ